MLKRTVFLALTLVAAFAVGPAWAGHDDDHGPGKGHEKGEKHDRSDGGRKASMDVRFVEPQRVVIHDYYVNEAHAGHCPPGLAKKHNGCLPPGQAKKLWAVGRPLPPNVVIYELPPPLIVQLGPPPPGYRYARVGGDVLLLGAGSRMVVDAIADIGRM